MFGISKRNAKIEVIIRKDSYHHWSHGAKVSVSQNLDGSNALYVNTFGIDSNDVGSRGNVPKIPDHEWEFRRISSATSWTVLDEYDAAIQATSHGSDITALTYESGATFEWKHCLRIMGLYYPAPNNISSFIVL